MSGLAINIRHRLTNGTFFLHVVDTLSVTFISRHTLQEMLDLTTLSDDACENLIEIVLKAKPACAMELVDVSGPEDTPNPSTGRFKGHVKSWWPDKGYGFLECAETFAVYE